MSRKQSAQTGGSPPAAITASVGAVVTAVPEGKTPFAVAYPLPESATATLTTKTSITFSLTKWSGACPPEQGQVVSLENVQRHVQGWRAQNARPVEA